MINSIRLNPAKNKILFLSDIHYNHKPAWSPAPFESRGFKTITEFNDWFYSKWNELVTPETIIVNLGDTHFGDAKGEEFRRMTMLPCKNHYMLWGNHMSGAKQIYREALQTKLNWAPVMADNMEVYPITVNNLTFVGVEQHFWIEGISVYCQHYAQYIWPEMSKDGFCLCGHSHSNCAELNPEAKTHGKILDVGIDNAVRFNGTPFFSWEEVKRIMQSKPKLQKDHH